MIHYINVYLLTNIIYIILYYIHTIYYIICVTYELYLSICILLTYMILRDILCYVNGGFVYTHEK